MGRLLGVSALLAAGAAAVGAVLAVRKRPRVYLRAKFGPILVHDDVTPGGERVRVLSQGGVYQSATFVDPAKCFDLVFEYYRAFDHVFDDESPANPRRRMLMLGGGGYAYPKHVISSYKDATMDVVEVDPLVTRIACKRFFVDQLREAYGRDRLNLVCADARDYLAGAAGFDYDVIFNDCFSGSVPSGGQQDESMFALARRALRDGGLYVLNVVDPEGAYGQEVAAAVELSLAVFDYAYVIPCLDDDFGEVDNVLVAASDAPCSLGGVEWAQFA